MLTYNNQFEIELKKLLDAEIERLTEIIMIGAAIDDHATYRMYVGKVIALKDVHAMCEEANAELAKR